MVISDKSLSPEGCLEQLYEKFEFARRYLHLLPPSAKTEMGACTAGLAVLSDAAQLDPNPAARKR